MRLRNIIGIVGVIALVGAGAWFFINGTSNSAVGPGGLPLIKADTNPVKLPPDDPGGEVMPNADSTVFSAISADPQKDPSMENLKLPAPAKNESVEFAGLKTGFAVPVAPEKTTENLFDTTTQPAAAPVPQAEPAQPKTANDYVSGFAPDALKTDAEKEHKPLPVAAQAIQVEKPEQPINPTPEARAAQEKAGPAIAVKKMEDAKVADVKAVVKTPAPEKEQTPPPPTPITNATANAAEAMEANEKAIVTPSVKPVPAAKPVPPVAKVETKVKNEKEIVAEDVAKEAHVSTAPVKTAAPAPAVVKTVTAPVAASTTATNASVKPGYYMQLASTPSSDEAPRLWSRLQGKYVQPLAGLSPVYQTAIVPGKGAYIRVQAGPLTETQATTRCKQLHLIDAKGGCLVFKR